MGIAVVAWGSLVWCPGSLQMQTRWRRDGPRLPLEFARISKDGRLTIVIHSGSKEQQTFWCLSALASLDEVRDNLRERERAKPADIHYLVRNGNSTPCIPQDVIRTMHAWLGLHSDLSAVVWTGLSSNWEEKRGKEFSVADAVAYLVELESKRDTATTTFERAREYVRNAPPEVQTEVRKQLQARGRAWQDAILSPILFEG